MVRKGLEGKRIMLAASRKTDEMSVLIQKQGGMSIVRSLQGTSFVDQDNLGLGLKRVMSEKTDWIIFTTGMGLKALVETSATIGVKERFIEWIHQAKIGCRGYKTKAALKDIGIIPTVEDDDGTTAGLIRALDSYDIRQQKVIVQLHGEVATRLKYFLLEKGAQYDEILPYKHIAPKEDTVKDACHAIMHGEVDAVCFTSAPQVRFLFDYAERSGCSAELQQAFHSCVHAVAVGKITAESLRDVGIQQMIVPEHERIGAMIIELSQFIRNGEDDETLSDDDSNLQGL